MIQSFIGENLKQLPFADLPFSVLTVHPQRTFIEKALLLHEEFLKQSDKVKPNRMSRHLYDLHRLMDTDFGMEAIKNSELFQTIVTHRKKYTPVRTIDYSLHTPQDINMIPGKDQLSAWKQDYETMKANMIYGESPSFEELLNRMKILKERFNLITHYGNLSTL